LKSVKTILVYFANAVNPFAQSDMLEKILGKLVSRILRKTFDCFVLLQPTWIFCYATRTPFARLEI